MNNDSRINFMKGAKAGVPVAIGYLPIAVAFGLVAKAAGAPPYITMLMSLVIFAGASQFVGVNLLAVGAAFGEIVLTTFFLNLRHFLMSAAIAQKLEGRTPKWGRALLAFGITDETFTVAALRPEKTVPGTFLLGVNTIAFLAWNAGTWLGLFLAAGLPEIVKDSMGIALYAMFIGLLIPSIKKSRPALVVAALAVAIHSALAWLPVFAGIPKGWSIIIAMMASALIGAALYPEEEN